MTEAARRRIRLALQVAASVAVLYVLARDLDQGRLSEVLARASWGWLGVALVVKGAALMIHELRLWVALPAPRPPVMQVVGIGLVAGMLNLVLPARGGDVAAIALMHRECKVPASTATAAVGIVTFLEAAIFGLFLLGALALGATRWREMIGAEALAQAQGALGLITLGGVAVAVGLVVVGRLLKRRAPSGKGWTPLDLVRDTASDTSAAFGTPGRAAMHLGLGALQVATTLGGFTAGLPAVGLDVEAPWLAASGVLAFSSVAAVVLPLSLGAGPAAASTLVLGAFGVDGASALAFAGAWWLVAHVPAVALGLPALWSRALARRRA